MLRAGGYGAIRRLRSNADVAILRYHAVCGPEGHAYASPAICVAPETFERHVAYLAGHYRVLPLPDVVAAMAAGRTLPKDTVVFTFDDGYADNLEAARVLHRHGVSGTFYITAGCLAGGQPFWPSELRHLLRHLPAGTHTLAAGAAKVTLDVSGEASRGAAVGTLTRLFKAHPIPVREALRAQLREAAAAPPMPRVMLTWEELAEMGRLGMTIGAHTLTHPNLPSAGLAEATDGDPSAAAQRLEGELGLPVTMFSYPNGGRRAVLHAGTPARGARGGIPGRDDLAQRLCRGRQRSLRAAARAGHRLARGSGVRAGGRAVRHAAGAAAGGSVMTAAERVPRRGRWWWRTTFRRTALSGRCGRCASSASWTRAAGRSPC